MITGTAEPYLSWHCKAIFTREAQYAADNTQYHSCIFTGYAVGGTADRGIYLCKCGQRWDHATRVFEWKEE